MTVIQRKPFALGFIWLISSLLQANHLNQCFFFLQLKTNFLIAENATPPPQYPVLSHTNPATSSGFHKPSVGGSAVALVFLNSNLQSLQKAMETSATCMASTLGDMQSLPEVDSTFLLTKLSMIYGLQVLAKVKTNGTTRNPDVSFHRRCPWAAS